MLCVRWTTGFNAGQRHSLSLPAPSVQAQGLGGSGHGQYLIEEDGEPEMEDKNMEKTKLSKPPYRVPSMAEVRASREFFSRSDKLGRREKVFSSSF